jgi:hypothetical protein
MLTLLLIGGTGSGKSAFINCLFGLTKNQERILAKEGDCESCTHDVKIYEIANSVIGPIKLIDTEGLHDTGVDSNDYDTIMKIFIAFYDNKIDTIDGILYLSKINDRLHFNKDMSLFSKIFKIEFACVKDSTMAVFTNLNQLREGAKDEEKKKVRNIGINNNLKYVFLDSKDPLVNDEYNQFGELTKTVRNLKKFEFPFAIFDDEICKIAKELQDQNKIIVDNNVNQPYIVKNNLENFEHKVSKYSNSWSSYFRTSRKDDTHIQKFVLEVDFPKNSINKILKIENVEVVKLINVKNYEIANQVFDTYAEFSSKIYFQECLNGEALITYRVKYSYSYETILSGTPEYCTLPIENYIEQAKAKFIDKKKKQKK